MFKLVLEKAEEPEIKLPTSSWSSEKQGVSRKTSISALLTMPKPLTVWITINCGKFWKIWDYQTTWPASWEICMQIRKQQLELVMELKSKDITLPTKVRLVKAMVFPVVMCGCESWTIKKAEHQRIDAFELWLWRRLLRVSWTARRSNQSILEEISPGYSLEGLMLKLKLQYFGHLMQRADSLEKTLMLRKIGGRRRREWQRMSDWMSSLTLWTWLWVNSGIYWWTGRPGVLRFMGPQRVRHDWATELNWTDANVWAFQVVQW